MQKNHKSVYIQCTYSTIHQQEHRFYHEDIDLKYHELGNGWTFIFASTLENIGNCTIGGVGMLLSPHVTKSLNIIEKIASRILAATFHGNPEQTLMLCYRPTNIADEQEVIYFYDDLSSFVHVICSFRPKTQCSHHWWRPKCTNWTKHTP